MKKIDNKNENWYDTGHMIIGNEKSNAKYTVLQALRDAIKTECDTFLENEKRIHKDRYPDVGRKIF